MIVDALPSGYSTDMELWCKHCGAFIGICEPVADESVDRTSICAQCALAQDSKFDLLIEKLTQSGPNDPEEPTP
jgi:hypothetical protein